MKPSHILLAVMVAMMLPVLASGQYNSNPWWQWARTDSAAAVTNPNTSSVLAVRNSKALWGRMNSIARFDGLGNPQGRYTLAEYDSAGHRLNLTVIYGKVQLLDAQSDAIGNWYVLGRFYDSAVFANGTMLARPGPATNPDADHFMVKFNAGTLNPAWIKTIGPLRDVSVNAFTLDANKLYLSCDSGSGTVIRSMNLSTGLPTTMFYQAGDNKTSSIQVDGSGNIYLAGSCAVNGINFNGATEPATAPDLYGYIVKYNSAGAHQWHYWFKDNDCYTRKLTLFKNSVLYYTGDMHDTMKLGATTTLHPGRGGYFAARLNPANGAVLWTRTNDSSGGGAVPGAPYHAVATEDTALVMFVEGSGYISWGDTFSTNLQSVNYAAVAAAISASDSMRWTRSVFALGTTNGHIATENDNLWVTGNAYGATGQVVFDTLHLNVVPLMYTPYIARLKLSPRPAVVVNPQGVGGVSVTRASVSPIPAKAALRIAGMNGGNASLHDLLGRVVARVNIAAGAGSTIMDVASLPRGSYVLELHAADGSRETRKIILQ